MRLMKHHNDLSPTVRTMKPQDNSTDDSIAMIQAASHLDGTRKLKSEPDSPRKSIDAYCDACGGHGHRWGDCDFLAKLIKSLQFLDSLEPSRKKNLLDTFHKEQVRKRSVKHNTALVRATRCMENNDIDGMYDIIHEIYNAVDDKGTDLTSKDMDSLEDDHRK